MKVEEAVNQFMEKNPFRKHRKKEVEAILTNYKRRGMEFPGHEDIKTFLDAGSEWKEIELNPSRKYYSAGPMDKRKTRVKWIGFEEMDWNEYRIGNQLKEEWYGQNLTRVEYEITISRNESKDKRTVLMSKFRNQRGMDKMWVKGKFQYFNPEGFENFKITRVFKWHDGSPPKVIGNHSAAPAPTR